MNVRALRFIVIELLRDFADDVTSFEELEEKFDSICQGNILAEILDKESYLIIIAGDVAYLCRETERERERRERERKRERERERERERDGEFPLHIYPCQKMLQYFFGAGHFN